MKRLMNYFLKGLLVFVPAALTVFTIVLVFTRLDGLLNPDFPYKSGASNANLIV